MCSPAAAAMAGVQVAGGFYQAEAERQAARAKKNYYDVLAAQNEEQAKTVLQRGEDQATAISGESAISQDTTERAARRVEGSQKAAFGASGVTLDSVTAEDVARDTMTTHAKDMAALRYDADSKVYAAKTAASDSAKALRDQSTSFRLAGRNAVDAGNMAATSTLLGTATSVAGNWYQWKQTGAGRSTVKSKTTGKQGYGFAPEAGNSYGNA